MRPLEDFSFKLTRAWLYWFVLLGLVTSITLGLVGNQTTGLPAQWNHFFLDTFIKTTANHDEVKNTVVVDIDELSLSAIGQWPWPRYRMATLVQAISDNKPSAIGLDILFSEPDRTSLSNIKAAFKQDFGLDITIGGATSGLSDNDGYFGHILSKAKAVGARFFYFNYTSNEKVPEQPAFVFDGKTAFLDLNDAPSMLNNTPKIASQVKFNGFVNNQADQDGFVRSVPLLIKHRGHIYPHLALATYMRSLDMNTATIDVDNNGPVIKVGLHRIPIDKRGYATIRFNNQPNTYPSISAVDIFNGYFDKNTIKNKTIFIGSSAAGLNDLHATLFDPHFPGLKLQSTIIENIVNDSFIRQPSWGQIATLLISILSGLIITILFINYREPFKLLLGPVMVGIVILLVSFLLFRNAGIFLSPGTPLVVIAVLFTLFTATRFVIEKRQAYAWFRKLSNARQVTMESMAAVAETRDPETGAHIKRTQHYVKAIAEQLQTQGLYADILTDDYINLLYASAPLHDIGKVGVPDHILLKPSKLNDEEFELMKKHAEYGKNIIYSTAEKIEGDNFLVVAGEIASTHHEKWDGTGYPLGLSGKDIPLSGRIMAVADVYDALISQRCYKAPYSHQDSLEMMRQERGKTFDPEVLEAFLNIEQQVQTIAKTYHDDSERVLGDR